MRAVGPAGARWCEQETHTKVTELEQRVERVEHERDEAIAERMKAIQRVRACTRVPHARSAMMAGLTLPRCSRTWLSVGATDGDCL